MTDGRTDGQTNGRTELRWLRRATAVAAVVRKKSADWPIVAHSRENGLTLSGFAASVQRLLSLYRRGTDLRKME